MSNVTNYIPPWDPITNVATTDPTYQPVAPGDHSSDSLRIFVDHHGSILDEDTNTYDSGYVWYASQGTDDLWTTFFTDYAQITVDQYNDDPYYYHGLFGTYWRDWYENSLTSGERSTYANTTNGIINSNIAETWTDYLDSSDILFRQRSAFQWVYEIMIEFTQQIQNVMLYQSNRSSVLVDAQDDAISAMSDQVSAYIIHSGSGTTNAQNAAKNNVIAADIGIYQSKAQTLSDSTSNITNETTNSSNYSKNVSSIMNKLIQMTESLLKGIFS
jgi:hypothetical protein